MISGLVQKHSRLVSDHVPAQVRNRESGIKGAIARKLMPLTIGFAAAGMMTIATTAVAQAAVSTPTATTQHSTCAAEAQGLMCNPGSREFEGNAVQGQAPASAISLTQPLSNAQMERLSDILLGLLYFVLPVGSGIGLFLYDRQQAQRMATLEAQIKLLEKLWEQTPQA